MEIMELEGHPYYVATQFHPEYLSRPLKPSPPFLGFILASVGKLNHFLAKGCRFTPKELSSDDDYSGLFPVKQVNALDSLMPFSDEEVPIVTPMKQLSMVNGHGGEH
jgi:Glutamine amidotransferase class-I